MPEWLGLVERSCCVHLFIGDRHALPHSWLCVNGLEVILVLSADLTSAENLAYAG